MARAPAASLSPLAGGRKGRPAGRGAALSRASVFAMRRRGLEPPPGYPGPGPQPGDASVRSVRIAPDRLHRPAARTIRTHRTIWMLPRMLPRAGTRNRRVAQRRRSRTAVRHPRKRPRSRPGMCAAGRNAGTLAPMSGRRLHTLLEGGSFFEAPRWHDGRWWVSDLHRRLVLTVDAEGRAAEVLEVAGQPSGMGWLPDGSLLVVSTRDRRARRARSAHGTRKLLQRDASSPRGGQERPPGRQRDRHAGDGRSFKLHISLHETTGHRLVGVTLRD